MRNASPRRGHVRKRRAGGSGAAAGLAFLAAAALFALWPQPGRAEGPAHPRPSAAGGIYGLRFGVLAHDVGGLWSRSRAEGGADLNAEILFDRPGVELLGGKVLSSVGGSLNLEGQTSKAYAGLLWERLFGEGFFCNTGIGLALHDGRLDTEDPDRKSLGARVLFRVPVEVGVILSPRYRLSLFFDHVSNGYLAHPNEGMDTLGLRLGLQF